MSRRSQPPTVVRSVSSRRQHLFVWVVAFLLLAAARGGGVGRFDPPGSAYGSAGARPERGYFSQFPWSRVDMVTGELTLTFTDLVLPGNAGMDLQITRTYSRQRGWAVSVGSVPLWIEESVAPPSPAVHKPKLLMADGSRQSLYSGVSGYSGYWVTTGFAKLDLANRTLYLPNGWIATYQTSTDNSPLKLDEVHDAYGNSLTPEWDGLRIVEVVQTVSDSATRTRTVELGYNGALLTDVSYDGRDWEWPGQPDADYLSLGSRDPVRLRLGQSHREGLRRLHDLRGQYLLSPVRPHDGRGLR